MNKAGLKIVFFGLSITSSWGNGHATTYRGLVRGLAGRGHDVLFLERDRPWYAANRDFPSSPDARIEVYRNLRDLKQRFAQVVRDADFVLVGSYVPEGVAVGQWVLRTASGATAFYDIDTPVTLSKLRAGGTDYISQRLVRRYQLYLSFTGGPILERIEREFGAPMARPLYCSVDPRLYFPEPSEPHWDLGYLGTYSPDRQPVLDRLLLEPARELPDSRFIVAGPQYPKSIRWPGNVERIIHLAPREHRCFYTRQKFTLNVTRASMVEAGWSPSVRLFEAAACGAPIISDVWSGLETFFEPNEEILLACNEKDVMRILRELPESDRQEIGQRARARVLKKHTAARRAVELESYVRELLRRPEPEPAPARGGT